MLPDRARRRHRNSIDAKRKSLVREHGRKVVDLRVPVSLGRLGLHRIPGLSRDQVRAVEAGIASGRSGPILDIEDADGDGVRIVLE